jgi:hypothetical protein
MHDATITAAAMEDVDALADTMSLAPANAERLRPLMAAKDGEPP